MDAIRRSYGTGMDAESIPCRRIAISGQAVSTSGRHPRLRELLTSAPTGRPDFSADLLRMLCGACCRCVHEPRSTKRAGGSVSQSFDDELSGEGKTLMFGQRRGALDQSGPLTLSQQLREDLAAAHGDVLAPGFHAVALHRFGAWADGTHSPVKSAMRLVYKVGYLVVRNVYGIEIPRTVQLGRRVKIAHQSGIVIHPDTSIGDDCVIRQNVSIGAAAADPGRAHNQAPRLGRGVSVGAGAVIVGGVTIGDGAVLGPNVTVLTSVPANTRVMASAPRTLQLPAAVATREKELRAQP
jgi:serine O-acetyltransferase